MDVIVVRPGGRVAALYTDDLPLALLGPAAIRRASRVEPDEQGRWWADLAPVGGPVLGPFARRSGALAAENSWLAERLADLPVA
jgi:hypothetical protein